MRGDLHRNDRHGALHRAWGYVFSNHLVGDYYEFGVYQGESLVASYRTYGQYRAWLTAQTHSPEPWRRELAGPYLAQPPARFLGFDTFAGMPANDEGARQFAPGTFVGSEAAVRERCAAVGLVAPQLALVPGLFSETQTAALRAGPAAIVNLDGDLYLSARDALEAVTPQIQQGTVLLCDDYHAFNARPDAGERRALTEWTASTGIVAEPWFAYHFLGHAFLCHRR